MKERFTHFRVLKVPRQLPDPHAYGYEKEDSFRDGLARLCDLYCDRVGQVLEYRHVFVHLRFADTIDGQPVDEWFPRFLLHAAPPPPPDIRRKRELSEIDKAYGFD